MVPCCGGFSNWEHNFRGKFYLNRYDWVEAHSEEEYDYHYDIDIFRHEAQKWYAEQECAHNQAINWDFLELLSFLQVKSSNDIAKYSAHGADYRNVAGHGL